MEVEWGTGSRLISQGFDEIAVAMHREMEPVLHCHQ